MSQELITINGVVIEQPTAFEPNWEVTYAEGSGRALTGQAILDPLFTVESYSAEFKYLTKEQAATIFQQIVPTPNKPLFQLHYYSWYYGRWQTRPFYVGKGSMKVRTLEENGEMLDTITCNFIGVDPII